MSMRVFAAALTLMFAGAAVAEAGKPQVVMTAQVLPGGNVSVATCGLKSNYGRIVASAPSGAQFTSGDVPTEAGCLGYSFAPPESGRYSAQAYELPRPGKTPRIAASITFDV